MDFSKALLSLQDDILCVGENRTNDPTLTLTPSAQKLASTRNCFEEYLQDEKIVIYGVNTGFGGSANSRTTDHEALQVALVQMLNSGCSRTATSDVAGHQDHMYRVSEISPATMPIKWVRAAMLIRAKTLLRGHSGVSPKVVENIFKLLNHNVTPVVPMRGSISASGDLTPLSYVASVLQGSPSTTVYDHSDANDFQIVTADDALSHIGLDSMVFGAKEALAVVNGTAFSEAVAVYAAFDAMQLAGLMQIMTAMAVEALAGHAESFHPFIAMARNLKNSDQAEISRNIIKFLDSSRLAKGVDTLHIDTLQVTGGTTIGTILANPELAQDRYALRTAAQWIAPSTFDIRTSSQQVLDELDSTSDNPIFDASDPQNPRIFNGGNFMASNISNAMDKTRNAIQVFGKLVFAQCSEMVNPATNNGMPPNLAATDPSLDFACKGLDINMAAYLSELGMLANPVTPHVQSAEMHNQSINSLALLSGRKTNEAIEIFQTMCASYLYVLCQAHDIRAMNSIFFQEVERDIKAPLSVVCGEQLAADVWICLRKGWESASTKDLIQRADKAVSDATSLVLSWYTDSFYEFSSPDTKPSPVQSHRSSESANICEEIKAWQSEVKELLVSKYKQVRTSHFANYACATPQFLSKYTSKMYAFIRRDLQVPMFQGLGDSPTRENGKKSIGGYVGVIELALRERRVQAVMLDCMREITGLE